MVLFYGLIIKPIFVALSLPSEEIIDVFVLSPLTLSEYWSGSTLLLSAYGLFVIAMVLTSHFLSRFRKPLPKNGDFYFSPRRAFLLLIIGFFGFSCFLWIHPELLIGANKNVLASDDLSSYSGDGVLRLLISFLYIIPFFMLVNIAQNQRQISSKKILLLSAFFWILFSVISDQRGLILFSVLSWVFACNTFVLSLRRKYVLLMLGLATSLVLIKSLQRLGADGSNFVESFNDIIVNYIGRNFVENGKSLIIINAIPDKLSFSYGTSYLDSVLILIPRSLLTSKVTVNLDTIIGNNVFGCTSFGSCAIPPGLLAESYYNFGFPWVILMALLCGWMTAWLDWKSTNSSQLFRLFYVSTLVYFSISVLGSGVASFITQLMAYSVILIFAWYTLRIRKIETFKI